MAASDRPDRPRRDPSSVGGRRQPSGIEKAQRTPGAPPRRPVAKTQRAPKPELPTNVRPELPKAVLREIRKAVQNDHLLADEISVALWLGSEAIDADEPETALPYLVWAKDVVPRSPAIREALGVARYLTEDYASALTELQAYRRLSGRADQNHLIADCLRALGRETDKIADLVEEMRDAEDVPVDRRAEGVIVWASALADGGDIGAGRAVIRRQLEVLPAGGDPTEPELRLWYVAGDLAERAEDRDDARRWFSRIAEEDPELFDVDERLEQL